MQFDMTKTPPTQQEIDQAREGLETKIKGLRRWSSAIAWFIGTVLLVDLTVLWSKGLLSGKVAGTLLAFAANTLFIVAAGVTGVTGVAFVVGIIFVIGVTFLIGAASVTVAGVAVGVAGVAGLFVIDHRFTDYGSTIALLSPLQDESEECIALVSACRSDPQCDAYRRAVVRQGRPLVMGEAEELIRSQRQEACAILILKSTEKMV